jgi:ABC-2 type transport system ATP-binding protein
VEKMMDAVVEIRDLKKEFRVGLRRKLVQAVKGISFAVKPGELFGIVGPNGAGKTTTIKIITGLMRPTSGSASMFGKPVDDIESRRRMGYLPESPYFYEHLTAEELLAYYGSLLGMSGEQIAARSKELIHTVGLEHAKGRPLKRFSKGMRQRAGIAQALIHDPELVILDEPQSGLDPFGRKEVRDLLFELKRAGKTVILSSHILPDVEAVCDRVAVLHHGELKEIGTMHELTSDRVESVEIMVRKLAADALPPEVQAQSVETRGDLLLIKVAGAANLQDVLGLLWAAGGEVTSVVPQRESLEDVFMRDTAAGEVRP